MKKQIKDNCARPIWGLFEESFWKHPIKWLKDLKIYRDRIKYMKKYGYSPQAEWESFIWFIDVMQNILMFYRYNRNGTPYVLDEPWDGSPVQNKRNEEFYNAELDKMINLLTQMDDRINDTASTVEENQAEWNKMREACKEFFKMFAKYFYGFWD